MSDSAAAATTALFGDSQDLASCFDRDGFVVLPELLDRRILHAVCQDLTDACLNRTGETTETATPTAGEAAIAEFSCLQFPHLVSRRFLDALLAPNLVALLRHALGPVPKLMQSIVLFRTAGLDWHQDRHYLDTGASHLIGAWIALDDTQINNGCLWALPASHSAGTLWPHATDGDGGLSATGYPFREELAVPLEVDAGTGIMFDGHLLHRSATNRRTTGLRRALIGHFAASGTPSPWDGDNRFMPLHDGGSIEIVTGGTPYAHRG